MRRITLTLALLCCATFAATPAAAQIYHGDTRPSGMPNDTWYSIEEDHGDGFCDNISGSTGTAYPDIDCWEWAASGPHNIDQDCGTGSCTVKATVYCPYLGDIPGSPGNHWLTFQCSGSATDGVRAGRDFEPGFRGVKCGDITCGCRSWGAPLYWLFDFSGSHSHPAPNYYICY